MLRQKHSCPLILLLMVVVAASWRGWVVYHQSTLDRALIAAVTNDDAATTTTLLSEGASANAKDWREREAHGWLERAHHLLTGRSYAATPEPVLSIAMRCNNNAQIAQTLKQHGADEDAVAYWRAVSEWQNEDVAITNGIHLLHGIAHPAKSDVSTQMRNWIGKRVAFCYDEMADRTVDGGICLEIEWQPVNANPDSPREPARYPVPNISLVGTVRSIDVKNEVIHIQVKSTDYHQLMRRENCKRTAIVELRSMTTNDRETEIGLAEASDLPELLGLYRFLNPNDPVLAMDGALLDHWAAILRNPALHYVVARADGKVVGTCALTIIPNLTRSAQSY